MAMTSTYAAKEPLLSEVQALHGPALLEFGAPWCGFCRQAQPLIEGAMNDASQVHHLKVEDGKGRPLGRSFKVKLWPTLIFLRDGVEVARLVRPDTEQQIREALHQVAPGGSV